MNPATLYGHLKTICKTIGERPTGTLANRQVMEYIGRHLECLGYPVTYQLFDCKEWNVSRASLQSGDQNICVYANPYSPSCDLTTSVQIIRTLEELRYSDVSDTIVMITGDLSQTPLMPKNFPFFNLESHQEIIRLLEEKNPHAVIFTYPGKELTPILIDGDFSLPSVTISESDIPYLLDHSGTSIHLSIDSETTPSRAANVLCQIPGEGKKIVLCAHFDTKYYTPGALDNASGVAALLVLVDRLRRGPPKNNIEFVFLNGEECYNAPGEMAYLSSDSVNLQAIGLVINLDGIGLCGNPSSVAYFSMPHTYEAVAEETRKKYPGVVRVDPWPEGDHMIFAQKNIPSIAFSTAAEGNVMKNIIHTSLDTMDRLDIGKIMHTIDAIEATVRKLSKIIN